MKKYIVPSLVVGLLATCPSAYPQAPIPGDVASAGLTYIVPDTQVWYNKNKLPSHVFEGYVTNGLIYDTADQIGTGYTGDGGNHGNWEPYISVMGDSTFLVGVSIYADDGSWNNSTNHIGVTGNQRYVLALQPAKGGQPKIAEAYYDDFGNPYSYHQMMRQRNPGVRVAGDKRYGATQFVSGGAAALHYCNHWFGIDYFNQDGRLNTTGTIYGWGVFSDCNNVCRDIPPGTWDTQWAFLQPFSLNPATLGQTPLAKAFDPIYASTSLTTNSTPSNTGNNMTYFGGDVVALSDGNYVVVPDEYTGFFGTTPGAAAGVAKIFRPDGSSVKDAWLVYAKELWGNVAAYKDGWAAKISDKIFFFKNNGDPIGTNDITSAAMGGMQFDAGRGDGTRIASDIRSHYVYIAGSVNLGGGSNSCSLGIWDGLTGAFITNAVVSSDLDATVLAMDRVNLAVDALDRICVAYAAKPDSTAGYVNNEMLARVMKFDGTNVTYLTPTFFPFISSDNTNNIQAYGQQGYRSQNPSVAMTTKAICIAAKTILNPTNNPAGGPDSNIANYDTDAYVVISHPAPMVPPRPVMTLTRPDSSHLTISWDADAGLFTLQSTSTLPSGWSNVSPQPAIVKVGTNYQMTVPIAGGNDFFRLARW